MLKKWKWRKGRGNSSSDRNCLPQEYEAKILSRTPPYIHRIARYILKWMGERSSTSYLVILPVNLLSLGKNFAIRLNRRKKDILRSAWHHVIIMRRTVRQRVFQFSIGSVVTRHASREAYVVLVITATLLGLSAVLPFAAHFATACIVLLLVLHILIQQRMLNNTRESGRQALEALSRHLASKSKQAEKIQSFLSGLADQQSPTRVFETVTDPTWMSSPPYKNENKSTTVSQLLAKRVAFLDCIEGFSCYPIVPWAGQDYMRLVESQVFAIRRYQLVNGRIEDPVDPADDYYATPCYAYAVASLVASGRSIDLDLLNSGKRAFDRALSDMAERRQTHNIFNVSNYDFYMFPLMLALDLYAEFSSAETVARWRSQLGKINPYSTYFVKLGPTANNWNIFSLAGEFLRGQAGLSSLDYVEESLKHQIKHFTPLGLYNEEGCPLAYDQQVRYLISAILHRGYRGSFYEPLRRYAATGAWVSLFMQSPHGDSPTGNRSSHHLWNEAQSVALYETFASQYARLGMMKEAGVFKRAAHLSASVLRRWIRPDGSGCVVKNWYPIQNRHGYETYSTHTTYNMLAASALCWAWQVSDDSIEERPSPAEIGGYVIKLDDPFRKVFANACGTFIEYDTGGDRGKRQYNPTGLLRIHLRGAPPELGPSDGCAPCLSGLGQNMAVGPAWQDGHGIWHSLAESRPDVPDMTILEETQNSVCLKLDFRSVLPNTDANLISIQEIITIDDNGVSIKDNISGDDIQRVHVTYPALVTDGREKYRLSIDGVGLTHSSGNGIVSVFFESPSECKIIRSGVPLVCPYGLIEPIIAESEGITITTRISTATERDKI